MIVIHRGAFGLDISYPNTLAIFELLSRKISLSQMWLGD